MCVCHSISNWLGRASNSGLQDPSHVGCGWHGCVCVAGRYVRLPISRPAYVSHASLRLPRQPRSPCFPGTRYTHPDRNLRTHRPQLANSPQSQPRCAMHQCSLPKHIFFDASARLPALRSTDSKKILCLQHQKIPFSRFRKTTTTTIKEKRARVSQKSAQHNGHTHG